MIFDVSLTDGPSTVGAVLLASHVALLIALIVESVRRWGRP